MRVRLIVGSVLVLAVALAWIGRSWLAGGVPVDVAEARTGPVREYVDEEGRTRLPRTYLITMPCDGRILPIDLEEGTAVRKGEVVARVAVADLDGRVAELAAAVQRLDASLRENADAQMEESVYQQTLQYLQSMDRTVEASKAQVKAGEAKLSFANLTLERLRRLRQQRQAASEEDLNRTEVDQVSANTQHQQDLLTLRALESLRAATALAPTVVRQYIDRKTLRAAVLSGERAEAVARLDQARRDRDRGPMTSPVDGVVLHRHVSSEARLAAGTTLLEIGQPDSLEVEADVLTQDAGGIGPGSPATVYGPAVGKPDARGTVRRVDPAGFTKLSSLGVEQQRVKVIVSLSSEDLSRLRRERQVGIGYRVRVRIVTAEKPEALRLPRAALFRGNGGDWQAFVVRGGRARLQSLQIGLMNDDVVEVVGGVTEGEAVILAPEASLTDDTRVRPLVQSAPD
jgi:HlyD family secretion protein